MKQKLTLFAFALLILGGAIIGCSRFQSSTNSNTANKSFLEQAEDTVFGNEKTGIPQCDQILTQLDKQTASANESTLDSAKRIAVKQAILRAVREKAGVANMSQQDKASYGNRCQQIYEQFASATPSPAKTQTKK